VTEAVTPVILRIVPYADPEKAREAARLRQQKLRSTRKLEKLKGDKAPQEGAPKNSHAQVVGVIQTPAMQLDPKGMTREQWARELVALGVSWINRGNLLLEAKPRDAVHLGRAGVDLVNANIIFLPSDRDGEPQRGSLAVVDAKFLNDPVFREHATGLLRRKRELMEAAEAQGA